MRLSAARTQGCITITIKSYDNCKLKMFAGVIEAVEEEKEEEEQGSPARQITKVPSSSYLWHVPKKHK